MVDLSKLSENLQELMSERGLTQTSLAEAMHTCSSKISSYLTERRAPNYDTFVGFIEFFHCSADFLLGLKENVYENDTYTGAALSRAPPNHFTENGDQPISFCEADKDFMGRFLSLADGEEQPLFG